jgi:hypothetical protein
MVLSQVIFSHYGRDGYVLVGRGLGLGMRCTLVHDGMHFFFLPLILICLSDKLPEPRSHIRVSDLLLYLLLPSSSEIHVLILLYISVAD